MTNRKEDQDIVLLFREKTVLDLIRARRLHEKMRSWVIGSNDRMPVIRTVIASGNVLWEQRRGHFLQTNWRSNRSYISGIPLLTRFFIWGKRGQPIVLFSPSFLDLSITSKEVNAVTNQEVRNYRGFRSGRRKTPFWTTSSMSCSVIWRRYQTILLGYL